MLRDLGWLKQVKLENVAGNVINPATTEKLEELKTALQAIYGAVDGLELITGNISIDAAQINLNTDELEDKVQSVRDQLDVLLSTRASEITLSNVKTVLDNIKLVIDSIDSSVATETTLVAVKDAVDTVESKLQDIINSLDVNLSTRLAENTFIGRIGEVQVTPTQYTLLRRLKDLWDKLHDLFVTGVGKIRIWDGTNQAKVDATGRIYTASNIVPPPDKTPVKVTQYGVVATTSDNFYVIPNGESLYLNSLCAGAEYDGTGGSVIELYYAPNGNTTGIIIICAIFCNGLSNSGDLQEIYAGDGTKSILLRRRRLGGGSKELFGKWQGYY